MRRFTARLRSGLLVLGLALVLVPAAQARPASAENAGATLTQSVQSSRHTATSGNKIRTNVRKGFIAINAANKKLYACKWGGCTKAGKTLRAAAQHWLGVLRPMKAETTTVAEGLFSARTSLNYWAKTGLDAINADAAAKAKKQAKFDHWYALYKAHYKLGLKYQNRAVSILSKG